MGDHEKTSDMLPVDETFPPKSSLGDLVYKRSRKAWNAGIVSAGAAIGAVSIVGLFNEDGINGAAVGGAIATVFGAFIVPFTTAFFSKNEG